MNYKIQELNQEEMKYIYDHWMIRHFPAEEIKPWKNICRMLEQGNYHGYGMFCDSADQSDSLSDATADRKLVEEEALCETVEDQDGSAGNARLLYSHEKDYIVGYAFFAGSRDANLILLDYFAILEAYRSQGAGSHFFTQMKELVTDEVGILIETEDIARAEGQVEQEICSRRNSFYERAGAAQAGMSTEIFGVPYMIWYYSFSGEMIDMETCRENLKKIYREMIPEEKHQRDVRI